MTRLAPKDSSDALPPLPPIEEYARNLELTVRPFAECLFGRPVTLIYRERNIFNRGRPWIFLSRSEGQQAAVCASGGGGYRAEGRGFARSSYWQSVLSLAEYLRGEGSAVLHEGFLRVLPLYEFGYAVYSEEPVGELLGMLWFTESSAGFFETTPLVRRNALPEQKLCVSVTIEIELRDVPQWSADHSTRVLWSDLKHCGLVVPETSALMNFELLGLRGRRGIEIEIISEENCMEEEPSTADRCGVKLCLGTIDIRLDDFLNLRPGQVIRFDRPDLLRGSLQVGGSDWLEVDIEMGEGCIELKVRDFIGLESPCGSA